VGAVDACLGDAELREDALRAIAHAASQRRARKQAPHVAVGTVGLFAFDDDREGSRDDPVMDAASENKTVSLEAEGGDRLLDDAGRDAEIHEGADRHVAGDARYGIEEEGEPLPHATGDRRDHREFAEDRNLGVLRRGVRGRVMVTVRVHVIVAVIMAVLSFSAHRVQLARFPSFGVDKHLTDR